MINEFPFSFGSSSSLFSCAIRRQRAHTPRLFPWCLTDGNALTHRPNSYIPRHLIQVPKSTLAHMGCTQQMPQTCCWFKSVYQSQRSQLLYLLLIDSVVLDQMHCGISWKVSSWVTAKNRFFSGRESSHFSRVFPHFPTPWILSRITSGCADCLELAAQKKRASFYI